MQGQLTPEQQLQVLSRVWGNDRNGWVFLPWISGKCETKEERRKNFHEGRAFRWPKERDVILDHLDSHSQDDLYFAPNLFDGKRRIEQNVSPERCLYADLDPVDPAALGTLRPTIAWESSPGHFQGIWVLDRERTGATWAGKENHRLTVALEADHSGWDATQLLRVPGRLNYKPEYKEENRGKPVAGKLLWDNGPRYVWEDFDDLPEVGALVIDDIELVDEELIDSVDRHEVWARVRLKLSHRVREFMAQRTLPEGLDNSDIRWEINRELADAGCTLVEIVAIMRASIWNKYANRNDEMKMLKLEAAKAVASRNTEVLEDAETPKPNIIWLKDVVKQPIPRPKWLIKDIWTRGGCGFIAGAPKSYKSWMGLDMAVAVATGGYFLNQRQFRVMKPEPVLYLQEEDNLLLVMDRLANVAESKSPERFWHGQMMIVGGDTQVGMKVSVPSSARSGNVIWAPPVGDIPLAVHVQTGFIASDPGWQAWLDDILEEGQFGMVIIDTLGTVAGDIDTDKTGPMMNEMLKPLKQLANKHDCAVVMVHHNKKAATDAKGNRAGNDMLGAVGLHAWVDCAVYARAKEGKDEIAIEREAKMAQDMSLRVRIPLMYWADDRKLWDPEIVTEGLEQIHEVEEKPEATRRTPGQAGKIIATKLKSMGKGAKTFDEINEVMQMSTSKLLQQLNAAVANGFLTQDDAGETWRIS